MRRIGLAVVLAISMFLVPPAADAQQRDLIFVDRLHDVGRAHNGDDHPQLDPARVIAKDLAHSRGEPRFYCIGDTGAGVLTVRFTYRGNVIRIIGAGYWRRGKKIYEEQAKVSR